MKAQDFHEAFWIKERIEEQGFNVIFGKGREYTTETIAIRHKTLKSVANIFDSTESAYSWIMGFVTGSEFSKK